MEQADAQRKEIQGTSAQLLSTPLVARIKRLKGIKLWNFSSRNRVYALGLLPILISRAGFFLISGLRKQDIIDVFPSSRLTIERNLDRSKKMTYSMTMKIDEEIEECKNMMPQSWWTLRQQHWTISKAS
jgi:hypothetical protein